MDIPNKCVHFERVLKNKTSYNLMEWIIIHELLGDGYSKYYRCFLNSKVKWIIIHVIKICYNLYEHNLVDKDVTIYKRVEVRFKLRFFSLIHFNHEYLTTCLFEKKRRLVTHSDLRFITNYWIGVFWFCL